MNEAAIRIDKWLWYARFFKSRSLATRHCAQGRIRVNGNRVSKANSSISPGDVLTFAKGAQVFVVRVAALGERRGPAKEAALLYEDLSPPRDNGEVAIKTGSGSEAPGRRDRGAGRPTKAERRAIDRLKGE